MKTFVKGILVGMTVLDMALLPFSCSGSKKKAVKENPYETEPTVLTQTEDDTSVIDNSIACVWIIKYNDVTKYIYQQQVDKGGYLHEPNIKTEFNVEGWCIKNGEEEKRLTFPYKTIESDYSVEFNLDPNKNPIYNCLVIYAYGVTN